MAYEFGYKVESTGEIRVCKFAKKISEDDAVDFLSKRLGSKVIPMTKKQAYVFTTDGLLNVTSWCAPEEDIYGREAIEEVGEDKPIYYFGKISRNKAYEILEIIMNNLEDEDAKEIPADLLEYISEKCGKKGTLVKANTVLK